MSDAPVDPPLLWNGRAAPYAELVRDHPVFPRLAEELVALLPADFDGLAVDLGAGTGILAEHLLAALPAARAVLVEPAPAMLALARQRLADHPRVGSVRSFAEVDGASANDVQRAASDHHPGFLALRAEELPGPIGGAAAVLASASAHLFDDTRALPAIAAALAPGGLYAFHLWGHALEETADDLGPGAGWRPAVERAARALGIRLPDLRTPGSAHQASGRAASDTRGERAHGSSSTLRTRAGLVELAARSGLTLVSCRIHAVPLSGSFQLDFLGLDPARLLGVDPERARNLLDLARRDPGPGIEAPLATFCFRRNAGPLPGTSEAGA